MHIEYNDIISVENLLCAWKEFQTGKKYKSDVMEFSHNLMKNIFEIHEELKNKTYAHGPYQYFRITDPKPRDIHKATVKDRLIHHAIYRILYLEFDKKFIYDSYSCRDNKGTHKALNRFRYFTRIVSHNYTKQCFVLKCDIRKFFASINHNILFGILRKNIGDPDVIILIEKIVKSFNVNNKPKNGLPLGNLTSQLLVNIYMNEFDHFVKRELKQKYYIRYADDFAFFDSNKQELTLILTEIRKFLLENLKLEIHPDKIYVQSIYSGIDYLGWIHFPHCRILRTQTKKRVIRNCHEKNVENETIQSYLGLLKHGNCHEIIRSIPILCYNHS